MAPPVTLKVTNRCLCSPLPQPCSLLFFADCNTLAVKKPIKKLPTTIEVTDKTTVQDVKNQLAKQAGGWDPERFGLFDPEKKKILKDRKALISKQQDVIASKEILVKDLGTSWNSSTIEYG
jgi:very-long-chain enoyl-CoA reductase